MKIQNAIILTTDTPVEMTHEEMKRGDMQGCIVLERTAIPDEILRWMDQVLEGNCHD